MPGQIWFCLFSFCSVVQIMQQTMEAPSLQCFLASGSWQLKESSWVGMWRGLCSDELLFLTYIFYWSIVDLLCFRCIGRWFSYTYTHILFLELFSIISSVNQSCLTLSDPMNCSTPGLPVYHQLSEFTQTHVHQVGDAIHPSHPLSSSSSPAPNASQHQSLFQWVNSSHEVAKVLEFQL